MIRMMEEWYIRIEVIANRRVSSERKSRCRRCSNCATATAAAATANLFLSLNQIFMETTHLPHNYRQAFVFISKEIEWKDEEEAEEEREGQEKEKEEEEEEEEKDKEGRPLIYHGKKISQPWIY